MMNKLILLLFFSFVNLFAAPPAQERYLQAHKLYEQGEFAQAYELYKGIPYKSPELLINMGNTAFELGKFPDALVHWRQAQQYVKPQEYKMLQERITKLQHEHDGAFHSTRLQKIAQYIDLYMRYIPQKLWELLLLLLVALCFFIPSWIKHKHWSKLGVLSTLLFVVIAFLVVRYTIQNRLMGIVQRETYVHVNKDSQARIKASMPAGQEIEVRLIHDNWYQITDGIVTGWVVQNDVQLI